MTLEEIKGKYPSLLQNTIDYLKHPEIAEALNDEDFDAVFKRLTDSAIPIMAFLLKEIGIDPLQSLTYIPDRYFEALDLQHVVLGPNIQTITGNSFSRAHIQHIDLSKTKIEKLPYMAFELCRDLISIQLPETLTIIDNCAFNNCSGLISIVIPDSVTNIGFEVFLNCSSLKEITIGRGVVSIGAGAFTGCYSVEVLNYNANVTSVYDSPFSNLGKRAERTVVNINSTIVPANLFHGCSDIDEVNMGNNITTIGDSAFSWCTGLKSIEIPSSVTYIGEEAFECCYGLTSAMIFGTETTIEPNAFQRCNDLQYVYSKTPDLGIIYLPYKCKIVYI